MPIHNKCMNLSRTEDLLMNDSNKKNIFFCFRYDGKTGRDMGKLRKSLEEYARSLEKFKTEIKQMVISEPRSDESEEVIRELAEHQAKSKNIIIFNYP